MVREERWASHNVFSREKGWSQMSEGEHDKRGLDSQAGPARQALEAGCQEKALTSNEIIILTTTIFNIKN